jgi:hypothetical protein
MSDELEIINGQTEHVRLGELTSVCVLSRCLGTSFMVCGNCGNEGHYAKKCSRPKLSTADLKKKKQLMDKIRSQRRRSKIKAGKCNYSHVLLHLSSKGKNLRHERCSTYVSHPFITTFVRP